ncbi:MAG TPA: hypothetical protein PLQ76_09130 [bacterium]|nr:hypothetical protein [bacterium]
MKRILPIISVVLLISLFSSIRLIAQEASVEDAKLSDPNSMIQNLLLVADNSSIKYSIYGESLRGLKFIEILSADKVLRHIDCLGKGQCRISGISMISELPSPIITAVARDNTDKEQREKIKVTLGKGGTKVYLISAIPDLVGFSPTTLIKNNETDNQTQDNATTNPVQPPQFTSDSTKGPDLTIETKTNDKNDYTLTITSKDPSGVNFIEILENGKFFDVETCDKKFECVFSKNIKNRKPGTNKYEIKTMNEKNALTIKEETMTFTE